VKYRRAAMVLNRIAGEGEAGRLSLPPGLDCTGWIPEDSAIRSADIAGMSVLTLPESPALSAVRGILGRLLEPSGPADGDVPRKTARA
jgi:hypothetical protein